MSKKHKELLKILKTTYDFATEETEVYVAPDGTITFGD